MSDWAGGSPPRTSRIGSSGADSKSTPKGRLFSIMDSWLRDILGHSEITIAAEISLPNTWNAPTSNLQQTPIKI